MGAPKIQNQKEKLAATKRAEELMNLPGLFERVKEDVFENENKDPEAIYKLNGDIETKEQELGLLVLKASLIEIVARLKIKGAKVDILRSNPKMISKLVATHKVDLEPQETAALKNLDRLMKSNGETGRMIRNHQFWEGIVSEGDSITEKVRVRFKKSFKENPVATTIVGALAAFGIGMAVGWTIESVKDYAKKKANDSNFDKKAAGGLFVAGLFATGVIYRKEIKTWLGTFLLPKEVKEMQDAVKRGEDIPKVIQAKIEKEGTKGKEIVEGTKKRISEAKGRVEVRKNKNTEIEKPEGETSPMKKEAAELMEASKYEVASKAFLQIYFATSKRYTDLNASQRTLNKLSTSKNINLGKLEEIYNKNKDAEKIPTDALGEAGGELDEKELFKLVQGIINFSKLSNRKDKKSLDIKTLFEDVWRNPMARSIENLGNGIVEKLKNGDLSNLANEFTKNSVDLAQENIKEVGKKLDEATGLKVDGLNENEVTAYRKIQASLLAGSYKLMSREDPIGTILDLHEEIKDYPEAIKLGREFQLNVQEKSPKIIEKAITQFEITNDKGENWLREGVKLDQITFVNACELLLLKEVIESPENEASSIAVLGVLLKSFQKPQIKNRYTYDLGIEFSKESSNIKVPGIKAIKPYLDRLVEVAGSGLLQGILEKITLGARTAELHATSLESDKMAEKFKENLTISFFEEGMGTSLELTGDAFASIVLALNLEDDLQDCDTGKDFLDLIRLNGGHVGSFEDRDGSLGIIIDTGWNVFIGRPSKILHESYNEGWNIGNTIKIWVGGSAFYVSAGAVKGFFKTARGKDGRQIFALRTRLTNAIIGGAKGLKYPVKAPLMALKGLKKGVTSGLTGIEAAKNTGRGLRDTKTRTLNWGRDIAQWKTGQNVENITITQKRLNYHLELADGPNGVINKTKEAFLHPLKASMQSYHEGKVKKFASRIAKQLNNFYDLTDISAYKTENLSKIDIKEINEASKRFGRFIKISKKKTEVLKEILKISKKHKDSSKAVELIQEILSELGLSSSESEQLAKRMSSPRKTKKIIDQIKAAGNLGSEAKEELGILRSTGTAIKKGAEKFKKAPDELEGTALKGKTKELAKQIKKIDKRVKEAEREISLLQRMREGPMHPKQAELLQKRLDDARQIISEGKVAKLELSKTGKVLEKLTEAKKALEGIPTDSSKFHKLTVELLAAEEAAEASLEVSDDIAKNIGKLGTLGTTAKWLGRSVAGAGALFSIYQSGAAGYEALTTDIEGRAGNKGIEAGLYGANAVADSAALAVMLGAKGAATTVASRAALPLIPITYAGEKILSTHLETTKKDYEWIQSNPYELMHHFYSTAGSVSIGDAWTTGFKTIGKNPIGYAAGTAASINTLGYAGSVALSGSGNDIFETQGTKDAWNESIDESIQDKVEIMHQMYRGLVASEKDRNIVLKMQENIGADEKNKAIESLIEKNYSKYHEYYFRKMGPSNLGTYQSASRFIQEANIFDRIMQARDEAKEAGNKFELNGNGTTYKLHEDDFDITGGIDNPKAKKMYMPDRIVKAYKETSLELLTSNTTLAENLEQIDTSYLLYLGNQLDLRYRSGKDSTGLLLISNYLELKRGINFGKAISQKMYTREISDEALKKAVEDLGNKNNESYLKFEKNNSKKTSALHALYKLAESYGYTGTAKEGSLKTFFNEKAASYHGLYWDGEVWKLQEAGMEFDDEIGSFLTKEMIQKLITSLRKKRGDIIEHRSDAIVSSAHEFENQTEHMAQVLEAGLKEGEKRGYQEAKIEGKLKDGDDLIKAPTVFNPMKLEYSKSPDALKKDYEKVIEYTKEETKWSEIKYNVESEKHIKLSRYDNDNDVWLTKAKDNTWSVGNSEVASANGLTLVQAIALGNLKNWTQEWVKGKDLTPDEPFEVDGQSIEANIEWALLDRSFIKHWNTFYDKIGLSNQNVVEFLNDRFGS